MLESVPPRLRSLGITAIDARLLGPSHSASNVAGVRRFGAEFIYFGFKQARACLFAEAFFAPVFLVSRGGVLGLPRYDFLLLVAIAIQGWMLWAKLETLDELVAQPQCR